MPQSNKAFSLKNEGNVFDHSGQSSKMYDKDVIRRKFDNGLAKMYAEALSYYRNHKYIEARDRFTDIEEISPDYKRTHAYLGRIEEENRKGQKRHEEVREDKQHNAIRKIDTPRIQQVNSLTPATAPIDRQDAVASALDDFESKSP
jgi:hypothetical protein